MSLFLNSDTAVRLYTDSTNVQIDGKNAVRKTNKNGSFYELSNIPAHELNSTHTVTIDGEVYKFSALSYCYKVVNNTNASPALVDLANAAFIYAMASYAYSLT